MTPNSRRGWFAAWMALTLFAAPGAAGTAASAAGFSDTGSHWSKGAVTWASSLGIVDGYEDGSFQPDKRVTEPEFLAMLLRAFPEAGAKTGSAGGAEWYDGYYETAGKLNWTVQHDTGGSLFNRGHVAQLIASTQGQKLGMKEAVTYLLNRKLSEGKTSATVEGYGATDSLTRAEAVQFLRNAKEKGLAISGTRAAGAAADAVPAAGMSGVSEAPLARKELQVRGISIGDAESAVTAALGQPARKDLSRYGFDWYIYNEDLLKYAQVGIQDGKVVGLYTAGSDWQVPGKGKPGVTRTEVASALGESLKAIQKGNTNFLLSDDGESDMYLIDGAYVTFFYDLHDGGKVNGIQVVEQSVERALRSFYGTANSRLKESFERESFELANAARVQRGLPAYTWNDRVADVARMHSEDMMDRGYFEHASPDGKGPGARAAAQGLKYRLYGENIAAGQQDAVAAHHGWMNSSGHRKNILGDAKELGVGVSFGGDMHIYYTQNFFTGL